jgi:Domain of unknown function (DUF1905)/Bacteriocin-protection, YdeI or OmpD-Associated
MKQKFKAKLVSRGPKGAWTFLLVPFDVNSVFGTRARVPVSGTINGFPFRNSLMPEGDGSHAMMFGKELQKGSKAVAGDVVKVVLERDDSPRSVTLPEELVRGLKQNKHAGATFETLTYSQQKEYADWIVTAKQAVTKASRVAKAVELLAAGQRRLR